MSYMEARRGLDLRSEEGEVDGMCCFVTGAGKIRQSCRQSCNTVEQAHPMTSVTLDAPEQDS